MIESLHERLAADGSVTFRVKVRTQAHVSRFRGPLGEDTFKLDIAAVPEDGKANTELVRFLAETFDVQRASVEILSGESARIKVVRIRQ